MPPGAIVEGRQQDPLVEVWRGTRNRQRPEQAQHTRAAADLGRAGGAPLDVRGETRRIGRQEVIEQEQIDELSGACAIQGVADVRVRHIRYMTRAWQKVAEAFRGLALGAECSPITPSGLAKTGTPGKLQRPIG